jgi:hypothetical protein
VSPSFAVDIARLLAARASREVVASRLAEEPDAPPLDAVLSLGERARSSGRSEEETALAVGLLAALAPVTARESSQS